MSDRSKQDLEKTVAPAMGIFNLRLITEKYLERQKDIYACFIDYSKAFDTVKHQELLQCLKPTDIEENDIALIANLYWQQKNNS